MHKKAYYYSTLLGDSMNIAYALQAIGTTFLEIEKKDSALCYYEKAASWIQMCIRDRNGFEHYYLW